MTLADYIKQPGRSAAGLARDCGVHTSTITRAAAGSQPSYELMRAIVFNTGGVVTAADLVGVAA